MKKIMISLILLLGLSLFAQQWPVESLNIHSMFLQDGLPMDLVLQGEEPQNIESSLPGEPIYLYGEDHREIYSLPFENLIIIEHENRFQSFYQIPEVSSSLQLKSYVEEGDILGLLDNRSMGFALWDMDNSSWVNPLLFLPGGRDWGAPVLHSLILEGAGQSWNLNEGTRIPQGEYRLMLQLSAEPPYPLTPYAMEVRLLGSLHSEVEFNGIVYQNGSLKLLDNPFPYIEMGHGSRGLYRLGTIYLNQGNMNLDIRLQDYQGRQLQKSYTLEVLP